MFFYLHLLTVLNFFTPYDLTMAAGTIFGVFLMTLQLIITGFNDIETKLIYIGNCCVMGFIAGSTNAVFSTLSLPVEAYGFFMFVWPVVVNAMANIEFSRIVIKRCGNIEFIKRE